MSGQNRRGREAITAKLPVIPTPDVERSSPSAAEAPARTAGTAAVTSNPAGTQGMTRRRTAPIVLGAIAALLAVAAATVLFKPWETASAAGQVHVPQLAGATAADAARLIRDAGLRPGGEVRVPSEDAPEGSVISTDPEAGAAVQVGTIVTLTVSSGRPAPTSAPMSASPSHSAASTTTNPTTTSPAQATPPLTGSARTQVPQLAGLSVPAASHALETAGLRIGAVTERDGARAAGEVLDSSPAAGEPAARGAAVDVVLATGYQRVPTGLIGKPAEAATQALREAGFGVALEDTATDAAAPGTVLALSEAGGSRGPVGAEITVMVSRPPSRATSTPPQTPAPTSYKP